MRERRVLHFAYGANLDSREMARRCPTAVKSSKGTLNGYRFLINSRGVATVVPDGKSRVEGLLWSLSREDENRLDYFEGVPDYYQKQYLEVLPSIGRPVSALVYVAIDSVPGKPREGYLDKIIKNARYLGFPTKYISQLESLR